MFIKHSRLIIIVMISLFISSALAQNEFDNKLFYARQIKTPESLRPIFNQFLKNISIQMSGIISKSYLSREDIEVVLRQSMNMDTINDMMANLYAHILSLEELKDYVILTQSPISQRITKLMPFILDSLQSKFNQKGLEVIEILKNRIMKKGDSLGLTRIDSSLIHVSRNATIDQIPLVNGTYLLVDFPTPIIVIRAGSKQYEVALATNTVYEYDVRWKSNSEYDCIFIRTNDEQTPDTYVKGEVININVTEATVNKYQCITTARGQRNKVTLLKIPGFYEAEKILNIEKK